MFDTSAQWTGKLPLEFHLRNGRLRVKRATSAGRPEGRDNPAEWATKAHREHEYKDYLRTPQRPKLGKAATKAQKRARQREQRAAAAAATQRTS